jgi:hypothetical protein
MVRRTTHCKNSRGTMKQESDFAKIGAPALRALHNAGYTKPEHLSKVSKGEVSKLHGMEPKALGILEQTLEKEERAFKT